MSEPITAAEWAIMKEINADPEAENLLSAKCRWEGMSRFAVLREWGDPRTWRSYSAARPEEKGKGE